MNVEDYSEQEITDLIAAALSLDGSNQLFPSSGMHLGFAESSLFELLANKLENKFAHSELNSFLQELRDDLLSSKVPYDIKNLHTQVINCRKCKNFTPNPVLPMWNNQNPDIVFVLDYPIYNKEVAEFFLDTLKSSNFSSEKICLTYVNRCPYPKRKFESQEIFNCSPYLHTEIQLLNPKAIVCLGSVAASAVFGLEVTIKDYRSKPNWLGSWPIFVTYSPLHISKSSSHLEDSFASDMMYVHDYIYK